jgi:hypothetical protein
MPTSDVSCFFNPINYINRYIALLKHKMCVNLAIYTKSGAHWLPSGKQTVCNIEHGPVEIVDLPIKNI